MKVLESQKSRILSTKDYSIFNYTDYKIRKSTVIDLTVDINRKNLSKDMPIKVDDEYNILDGRHVFLALKSLNLPIHYKVCEVAERLDFLMAKKYSKKATPFDFCVHHKDKESYRYILDFAKKHHFPFNEVFSNIFDIPTNHKNRLYREFQEGFYECDLEKRTEIKSISRIVNVVSKHGLSSNNYGDYNFIYKKKDIPISVLESILSEYKEEITFLNDERSGCYDLRLFLYEIIHHFYTEKLYYAHKPHFISRNLLTPFRHMQKYDKIIKGFDGFPKEYYRSNMLVQKGNFDIDPALGSGYFELHLGWEDYLMSTTEAKKLGGNN